MVTLNKLNGVVGRDRAGCSNPDMWELIEKKCFPKMDERYINFLKTDRGASDKALEIPPLGSKVVSEPISLDDHNEILFTFVLCKSDSNMSNSEPAKVQNPPKEICENIEKSEFSFKFDTVSREIVNAPVTSTPTDYELELVNFWLNEEQNEASDSVNSSFVRKRPRSEDESVNSESVSILDELKQLQSELQAKEDDIQNNLKKLLADIKAEAEEAVFKVAEASAEQMREESILEIWNKRMDKLRDIHTQEDLKRVEEMEAICAICHSGETTHKDLIVFCDCCDIGVHLSCYRINGTLPKGDWYCRPCSEYIRGGGNPPEQVAKSGEVKGLKDLTCALCPLLGGAYSPADIAPTPVIPLSTDSDEKKSRFPYGTNNGFVHTACGQWLAHQNPDVTESGKGGFFVSKHLLKQDNTSNSLGRKRRCLYCEQTVGSMIKCTEGDCPSCFHVSCARVSTETYMDTTHAEGENQKWNVFCPTHTAEFRVSENKKRKLEQRQM